MVVLRVAPLVVLGINALGWLHELVVFNVMELLAGLLFIPSWLSVSK